MRPIYQYKNYINKMNNNLRNDNNKLGRNITK